MTDQMPDEPQGQLRRCEERDFKPVWEIINDAAKAYRGVIEPDCWHEPYMTQDQLPQEVRQGVELWGYENDGRLDGVMGIQYFPDVALIRHAYVRTVCRSQGIGGRLLLFLYRMTKLPVLIGTWKAAVWAIRFYEKYGFCTVSFEEKERLLRTYWTIPERQIETSIVLADPRWFDRQKKGQSQ
jgi:GNAT superfamily N-acetyltransferase